MSQNLDDAEDEVKKLLIMQLSPEKLREFSLYILKKPKEERSTKDKKIVQDYAVHIEFFKNILVEKGPQKLAELCDNLTYYYLQPGEVLFKQGSLGTAFYIILEGTVEVLINKVVQDEAGKDIIEQMKVAEIRTGQSFGELALTDPINKTRKSWIVGKQTCATHLAVLEKVAYDRILDYMSQEIDEQIEFLENIPFLKHLNISGRFIQQFVPLFEKKVYTMNHVIYREGEPCQEIYLVKSGEVKSTKKVQIRNPKPSFLIDEHNKLYPYEATALTKQVELGSTISGQFFGDEEALLAQFVQFKEEVKAHNYLKNRAPANERENFLMEMQNLLTQSTISKCIMPPQRTPKGITYRRNSLGKTEIKRESTVTIKSSKAEIWKIPATSFFKHLDISIPAYQYLFAKNEQNRRRREERLPSLAKITPTISPNKSGRKQVFTSDESFLSLIKQKKYAKQQYETLPLRSELEKSLDISFAESSPGRQNSPEIVEKPSSPPARKNLLDLTVVAEATTPVANNSKEVCNLSAENINAPKSLLLQKVKPFEEPTRKKTEPLLLVQGFLSHTESPTSARRRDSLRGEDNKINRISTKRGSVPAPEVDPLNESSSSIKVTPSPVKVSSRAKQQQAARQIQHRGRSTTPSKSKSLYDNDSPHCLFSKDPEKKPPQKKPTPLLTPIRSKPAMSPSPSKTPFQQMIHMRSMPAETKAPTPINIHMNQIKLKERVKRTKTADLPSTRDRGVSARVLDKIQRYDVKQSVARAFSRPRERADLIGTMRVTGFTKANDTAQSFFFGTEEERLHTSLSSQMKPKFQ